MQISCSQDVLRVLDNGTETAPLSGKGEGEGLKKNVTGVQRIIFYIDLVSLKFTTESMLVHVCPQL